MKSGSVDDGQMHGWINGWKIMGIKLYGSCTFLLLWTLGSVDDGRMHGWINEWGIGWDEQRTDNIHDTCFAVKSLLHGVAQTLPGEADPPNCVCMDNRKKHRTWLGPIKLSQTTLEVMRDRNLWSCNDRKGYSPEDHFLPNETASCYDCPTHLSHKCPTHCHECQTH